MKPGDHPEFFRTPAPEGRTRESSIVLDSNGRFWHEGLRVEHPGMARAFATWIQTHPDNGRFILNNGYDWTYFRVDDTPFFVESLAWAAEGSPALVLSNGEQEPLQIQNLSVGEGGVVFARVKGGEFEAKFTHAAQLGLAPLLVEVGAGQVGISLGDQQIQLPARLAPEARKPSPVGA